MAKLRMWDQFKSYYDKINRKKNVMELGGVFNGIAESYWKKVEYATQADENVKVEEA
jgi:hypothetical protein